MKSLRLLAILTLFAILITLLISCTTPSAGTNGITEQRTESVIESTIPISTEHIEETAKKGSSEPAETTMESVETKETTDSVIETTANATDTEETTTKTEETISNPPKETTMTTEPILPETNYAADFSVS
jgi:hypothetical protein